MKPSFLMRYMRRLNGNFLLSIYTLNQTEDGKQAYILAGSIELSPEATEAYRCLLIGNEIGDGEVVDSDYCTVKFEKMPDEVEE